MWSGQMPPYSQAKPWQSPKPSSTKDRYAASETALGTGGP
jgi:hypothetical protein